MKKLFILGSVMLAMGLTSCTTIYPGMATTASSVKSGEVRKKVWFGLAFDVDVSVAAAAKAAGITKVATVDRGVKGGLFSKTYITKVTGE